MDNRTQLKLDRAFFPVEKRVAYDDKGGRMHAIVDVAGGTVISRVSEKYTLVDNRRLVEPFVRRFGLPDKVVEYSNRKSYIFEFFTGRNVDFGDGDVIREKLVIANSYDRTKSFSFFFGAFRMVCTNGLYTAMGLAIAFKKIHVGEIPVDALVKSALENYEKNDFGFWKRLKERELSVDQELGILKDWVPFEFKKEKPEDVSLVEAGNNRIRRYAERAITGPETANNQRNAWGLFNVCNQAIKREYWTPKAVVKRIQGDRRTEVYLAEALKI